MTDSEYEFYCFLRLYLIDLDTASSIIPLLKRYKRDDVKISLLRDIAVTYARPFSVNKGIKIVNHQLALVHVPKSSRAIHQKLINLRNSQFAHTDLKFHAPKVARFGTQENPYYPMSFKSFDYQQLLNQTLEIEALIKAVEQNVIAKVRRYETNL